MCVRNCALSFCFGGVLRTLAYEAERVDMDDARQYFFLKK
jgi:hypothetical protein